MTKLPLEGIRIADFGQIVAIPYATQILAWMGAQVILIETKDRLGLRELPPFIDAKPGINRSGGFNALNNNKLSCTINISDPQGLNLAHRIISISDIMVENYSVGIMERLGLGYEAVRQIRPDIIYLSLTAFGNSGPMKDFRGFHSTVNLFSGMASITGYPEGYPRILGGTLPDFLAGNYSVLAILQALYYRLRSGTSQFIDVSMVDSLITTFPQSIIDYSLNGREPSLIGNRDQSKAPHDVFRCAGNDQWIAISVNNDRDWSALCKAMGHPEWIVDPRFADNLSRWHNQDALKPMIESWTMQLDPIKTAWQLQSKGITAAPTLSAGQLLEDPHMLKRGFVRSVNHPMSGNRPLATTGWTTLENTPPDVKHAPLFGQHNSWVFKDLLGMSEKEVDDYRDQGAICSSDDSEGLTE